MGIGNVKSCNTLKCQSGLKNTLSKNYIFLTSFFYIQEPAIAKYWEQDVIRYLKSNVVDFSFSDQNTYLGSSPNDIFYQLTAIFSRRSLIKMVEPQSIS